MKPTKKILYVILAAVIISVFAFNFNLVSAAEPKAEPSGAYLKYTVDVSKPEGENLAYHFMTLKRLDYIIQEGDMLEYDVYSYIEETGWGHIDGEIANVGVIRDSGLRDTEGRGVHTGSDLSDSVYGQWYRRSIILGVTEEDNGEKYTVGRALRQIQIAMHPSVSENDYQGVVLYDNIVITNNGEVKLVVFKDADDYIADQVRLSHRQGAEGGIEMLVFSDEEINAFKEEEERKIAEEASKEASREASREEAAASREAASIEQARLASIEQASIDESIAAAEAENDDEAQKSSGGGGANMTLVIGIIAGVVVLVIIILVIVGVKKKKSGKQ